MLGRWRRCSRNPPPASANVRNDNILAPEVGFTRRKRVYMSNTIMPSVFYRTLNVERLEIFYREAGPRNAPTVLLLHGFPSSSHMFRNLIPKLADNYRVIAPDLPGFGFSDSPPRSEFQYTFENLARVIAGRHCDGYRTID